MTTRMISKYGLLLAIAMLLTSAAPSQRTWADDTPSAEQPAAGEQSADAKPADEKPAPAADKPADEKPADAKSADEKPAKPEAADDKPATEEPAAEKPADQKPAADKPVETKAADEKPADEKPAVAEAATDAAAATAQWNKDFAAWKEILRQLYELRAKYASAGPDDLDKIRKEYTELLAKGEKLIPQLQAAAVAAFQAAPNEDRELTRFLVKLVADEIRRDAYEPAYKLSQTLIDHEADDKAVWNLAGIAAFCTNHFDEAETYFTKAGEAGALSNEGRQFSSMVKEYQGLWKKEQEIRAAEAKADDLPRVKLHTSKGDIVIELFENEAPQAVANFVSLVEKGFYTDLLFHRVLKGFMAQGGDPLGNGTGGPGYEIYCECHQPNHRKHFRGTISMAHAGRDTGGSQFFLTFVPTGQLNGRHTAFGRIIEGMEVLSELTRTQEGAPAPKNADKIVSAEVLRKRDHEYVPTKVQ